MPIDEEQRDFALEIRKDAGRTFQAMLDVRGAKGGTAPAKAPLLAC